MSGMTHNASRNRDTATITLWSRKSRKHAAEVAESLRRPGEEIVSLTIVGAGAHRYTAIYRLPSAEEIAQRILGSGDDTHAYRAVIEAVKAARA